MIGIHEPGPGSPDGSASLSIDAMPALFKAHPEALLSDRVLAFASKLDQVSFERLRRKLSDAYLGTGDLQAFVRGVKAYAGESRKSRRSSQQPPQDDRPTITISTDEATVNEQAAKAIGRLPGLYQRMGELVRVVESKRRRPGEPEPYVAKEIRIVTEPLLRELFTRAAKWIEVDEDPNGGATKLPAHPPDWCVKAVRAWQAWPDVLPLYHLAESPVVLPDGRVIQRSGYDHATGIMLDTKLAVNVAKGPTQGDAARAAAKILDLVSDVRNFENEAHRSAFMAAILTVVGRWAFTGQAPLFMIDANRRGTGKGFLMSIIDGIALGHPSDYTVQTADEDEERKLITAKVLAATPTVFIDEVNKPFGSAPLQGLLTSGVWAPRLLGTNEAPSYPAYIVWFAAGNNVQLATGDIERRVCFVRIVTDLDNPEERTGFKIDDMPAHVAEHRSELYEAALTMIRAWILTRMPADALPGWGGKWGGFDGWDQVIRGAVVFAGLADPIGAKASRVAPMVKEGISDLVVGVEQIAAAVGFAGEISASAIRDALVENDTERKERSFGIPTPPLKFASLRKGIASLAPHLKGATPSSQQLGTLLGHAKEQAVATPEGRKWLRRRHADGGLWRVEVVASPKVAPPEDEPDERAAIQAL